MLQSAIEPRALFKKIRERHCYGISRSELKVLFLLDAGYRNNEMAFLISCSDATIRRHLADLCQRVFDPTDIPPDRDKLRTWVRLHISCCALGVREMIESEQMIA